MQGGAVGAKALKRQAKIMLATVRMKCDKVLTQEANMTTHKTHYELHCDAGLGFFKLKDFATIEEARKAANSRQSRTEEFYKIVSVTVSTFDLPIFSVPAYIPDWQEVASDMSNVYAQDIDWSNEDYLALSETDREKARQLIEESTDACYNCGWTFETNYLSDTDHGLLCDRCESDLEEEDEEEDED
jgi:hypothetical protein